jgi:hypothetical protein
MKRIRSITKKPMNAQLPFDFDVQFLIDVLTASAKKKSTEEAS